MNEQVRDLLVDPKVLGRIRRATHADLPFIAYLAIECYPRRFSRDQFEPLLRWIHERLSRRDHCCLVGARSAGMARVEELYGCEPKARMVMLGARPHAGTEALRMIRVMLLWAKAIGATGTFTLDSDNGVDFEPFARRLGGRRTVILKYELPLD